MKETSFRLAFGTEAIMLVDFESPNFELRTMILSKMTFPYEKPGSLP